MASQDQPSQRIYFCEHCGEYLPPDSKVCSKCGYPVGGVPASAVQQSSFLASTKTASILFLISGLDGLIGAILLLSQLDSLVSDAMSMGYSYSESEIRAAFIAVIGFVLLASALTLAAAYLVRKKKHFHLVAVCGFFSIFTLGVFFLEASFLGLLGIVTLFRARREFT